MGQRKINGDTDSEYSLGVEVGSVSSQGGPESTQTFLSGTAPFCFPWKEIHPTLNTNKQFATKFCAKFRPGSPIGRGWARRTVETAGTSHQEPLKWSTGVAVH